ncbi:MAG: heme lyase CcmF/NrfE family subunit [Chloroflexota bacterium]|nr:heme lyase CcmF/NrfE family subunit [Chloroflexota bacterium]
MISILADVGAAALLLALLLSIYATAASFIGARRGISRLIASAKNTVFVVFGVLTLAVGMMEYFLLTGQFQVEYVAHYASRTQAFIYNLSALWGGQEGSLLFWGWVLAMFATIVLIQNRNASRHQELIPYVITGLMITEAFFLVLMTSVTSPFKLLDFVPEDGQGLNPLLQNIGMFFHPVTQYLGYVGFTVPFAFAMAALATGRLNDVWIRTTRRWTLFAWLMLSLGLLFGGQWAYVELGWGGYWGWDPVENASLMPWLTATAYLHSVMIQEKRGMLKIWNLVLVMLTFLLSILGTFITRSGIIQSVHAFGVSAMGPYFLVFMGGTLLVFVWLLFSRMDDLKEENELDSLVSRESSFLLNNLILVGAAFATLWGTIFPMISEAVTGKKITVGPPFYEHVNGPIFLGLVILVGICPLIGWRRATKENLIRNFLKPFAFAIATDVVLFILGIRDAGGLISFGVTAFVLMTIALEFFRGARARIKQYGENILLACFSLVERNRRRYGGYIVHIGVMLMVVGIAGSTFYKTDVQTNVKKGETITLRNYTVRYDGLKEVQRENHSAVIANISITQDGKPAGMLFPEKQFYPQQDQPSTEMAVRSTLSEDLYLILAGWEDDGSASLKVIIDPLIIWLWIGWIVLVGGTLIALWPDPREERALARIEGRETLVTAPAE